MMRLSLVLPLIVSILLFAGNVSVQDGAEAGELPRIVRIVDIRLYQAISAAFKKMPTYRCYPVIRFYKTVLAELTALNAQELGISNLSGLEHATNLERLDLSGNRITDVSLLAGLTHLRVLNLQDNEIRDISLLSGLKNLTQLNLKGNAIVDISPLTDLPALAVLNLQGNQIRDTSDLAFLKNRAHVNFKTLGGTVRGEIVNVPFEVPIDGVRIVLQAEDGREYMRTTNYGDYEFRDLPVGHYLLSLYKKGYRDWIGKPVTVVKGGDHNIPLKMVEMESLLTAFRRLLIYILLFCGITALVTFWFTKRWMAERVRS